MKIKQKSVMVNFLIFDNGVEAKLDTIINKLLDMIDADFSDFNLMNDIDRSLFKLVKQYCIDKIEDIQEVANIKRIYWNNNNAEVIYNLKHIIEDLCEEE